MKVVKSIASIRTIVTEEKQRQQKIGFVPTMGALHSGHLELIKRSIDENDFTIVSIFVNPAQFDKKEDFDNYPNFVSEDTKMLESEECDILFLPDAKEIYPSKENLSFNFGFLESNMEGKHRVGHFSGVGLIISKMFNILQPDKAYFGQKDMQQLAVIRKLAQDLNFNTEVIGVPTVREPSGLAMSSRNKRLSENQNKVAANIHKGLLFTKSLLIDNMDVSLSKSESFDFFSEFEELKVEYIEIVDSDTLEPLTELTSSKTTKRGISICIAVFIGNIRLIDNISFTV